MLIFSKWFSIENRPLNEHESIVKFCSMRHPWVNIRNRFALVRAGIPFTNWYGGFHSLTTRYVLFVNCSLFVQLCKVFPQCSLYWCSCFMSLCTMLYVLCCTHHSYITHLLYITGVALLAANNKTQYKKCGKMKVQRFIFRTETCCKCLKNNSCFRMFINLLPKFCINRRFECL